MVTLNQNFTQTIVGPHPQQPFFDQTFQAELQNKKSYNLYIKFLRPKAEHFSTLLGLASAGHSQKADF